MISPRRNETRYTKKELGHFDTVRRVTWLGLLINLVLCAVKFAAGIVGASHAIVADAVHSLSDSGTDVAVLVGVRYWSEPADDRHPYGHRRIETAITVFIGVSLAGVALGLAYHALATLRGPRPDPPGWVGFLAAALSIVVKEWLYRWTASVGGRVKSPAMIANAWHHRSDALSSIPAALAVAGARIVPGWYFLDNVGAVVVTMFIVQAAWRIAHPALGELVDTGAPEETLAFIRSTVLDVPNVKVVHAIRTRYIGPGLQVDLHVWVDGSMTVKEGHDVAEQVKRRLIDEGTDILDVLVHVEPEEETVAGG